MVQTLCGIQREQPIVTSKQTCQLFMYKYLFFFVVFFQSEYSCFRFTQKIYVEFLWIHAKHLNYETTTMFYSYNTEFSRRKNINFHKIFAWNRKLLLTDEKCQGRQILGKVTILTILLQFCWWNIPVIFCLLQVISIWILPKITYSLLDLKHTSWNCSEILKIMYAELWQFYILDIVRISKSRMTASSLIVFNFCDCMARPIINFYLNILENKKNGIDEINSVDWTALELDLIKFFLRNFDLSFCHRLNLKLSNITNCIIYNEEKLFVQSIDNTSNDNDKSNLQ